MTPHRSPAAVRLVAWLAALTAGYTLGCAPPAARMRPEGQPFAASDDSEVTIARAWLDWPMLLTVAATRADVVPLRTLLQPRLVTFEQHGDTVAMLDVTPHAVAPGPTGSQLVETFAVTRADADHVTFTMGAGLRRLPVRPPFALGELPESADAYLGGSEVLAAESAVVTRLAQVGEALELDELVGVREDAVALSLPALIFGEPQPLRPQLATLRLAVRLTPEPDTGPEFTARRTAPGQGIGYFEIPRRRAKAARADFYAMRWDRAAGPVTFAISREAPRALIPALVEGITYWNRAIGETLVAVTTGADPDAPPRPHEVLVRWLDWRDATFSRAEIQAHPITGALIGGELALTSAFARPPDALALARATAAPPVPAPAPAALAQPGPTSLCALSPTGMAGPWRDLRAAGAAAPDAAGAGAEQRAAADAIRLVVAHEAGHALGLRHNFAGSLGSALPDPAARQAAWEAYLAGDAAGAATSSSVMDYLHGADALLTGAALRNTVLPYDRAAIAWGYRADHPAAADLAPPPFCGDLDAGPELVGCAPFDTGPNPLASAAAEVLVGRQELPVQIVAALVALATRDASGEPVGPALARRATSPDRLAEEAARPLRRLISGLREGARALPAELARDGAGWRDPGDADAASSALLSAWSKPFGGLVGVLRAALGELTHYGHAPTALAREVKALLRETPETLAQRLFGAETPLDAATVARLRVDASELADATEQAFVRELLRAATGAPPAGTGSPVGQAARLLGGGGGDGEAPLRALTSTEAAALAALAQAVVLGERGEIELLPGFALPRPRFREDVRLAALRLLAPWFVAEAAWQQAPTLAIRRALSARLALLDDALSDAECGAPAAGEEDEGEGEAAVEVALGPEARAWAATEARLLSALLSL